MISRFIYQSDCWGVNQRSFMGMASFVCLRLMRCMLGETDKDKDENSGKFICN